ncbi:MAG: NAD-dependent epimerase/dehydratase family protein [Gammaproteobacteria bacterium]|nr:NAD-dependent epimerase/dehydratase family protein [Gammaproteobacteria bacterium]
MRVLITGARGFIGAAVKLELLDAGHEVIGIDCIGGAGIRVGDITRREDCVAACEGADVIVHSVAIHQAGRVAENPMQMVDVNVQGTLNILQAAANAGTRRIVYLSSAKVYGEPERLPSVETDLPRPREPYALAKLVAEQYCQRFHDTGGMEVVVIRPFSVYGPGQDLNCGYVGMALEALKTDGVVSFPGQADYLRDFVHIRDVARLCSMSVTADLPGYTVLNAGAGRAHTLEELVVMTANAADVDLSSHFRRASVETINRTWGDMGRAQALLGYRPEIDLAQGIVDTVAWFMNGARRKHA